MSDNYDTAICNFVQCLV